jgi:hypothetical protein
MQGEHKTWRERGAFIHEAFEPLFAFVESSRNLSAVQPSASAAEARTSILANEPAPVAPLATAQQYDVFICHASEDKATYVEPLALALRAVPLNVWYDSFVLRPGDSLSRKIDEGLRSSRYGIVVLSQAFFNKQWPESEYRALLAMQNAGNHRRIIPVWYGVTREDVGRYSPLLLDIFAIDGRLGIPSAVTQIVSVVRPDLQGSVAATESAAVSAAPASRFEEYDLAPYKIGDEGVPRDALPWQPYFVNQQPFIDMRFDEPQSIQVNSDRRWRINVLVRNVGSGTARSFRAFLPMLNIIAANTVERDTTSSVSFFVDDRNAFWEPLKPPSQAVLEYEDVSGVLYRQYGTLVQIPAPSGAFYRFELSELGKPFRVRSRIVGLEVPPSWIVPIPR